MFFARDIQAATAEQYGIPLEAMTGRNRERSLAWPRQEAMCLTRELKGYSYPHIGQLFHRHHTTVISACRATEQRRRDDPKVAEALRSVTTRLLAAAGS